MRIEIECGMNIWQACMFLCKESKQRGKGVCGDFNEIDIHATPFSDADDLVTIYGLKSEVRRLKKVLDDNGIIF